MATNPRTPAITVKSKIILVEDHPLLRDGLSARINKEKDMAVCCQTDNTRDTLQAILALQPDCIVVDILLKEENGIELIKEIKARHPKLAVLVLSMCDESLYGERALRAGAKGYVMKRTKPDCLIKAIRDVLRGEISISQRLTKKLLSQAEEREKLSQSDAVERLNDREMEIYRWMKRGLGTRIISQLSCLSVKVVATHKKSIKQKLNVTDDRSSVERWIDWLQSHPSDCA